MKIKRQQFHIRFFQMLFMASFIFMSSFAYGEEVIELEFGNEALEEYKTFQLEEGYVYESLDERIVTIEDNLLIANRFGDTKLLVKENGEVIKEIEVIVYFVGDELTPWSEATINKPYISGYPDKTFRPMNFVTRAEMASIFAELLQLKHRNTIEYSDLDETHWGYDAIQSVVENDMMPSRTDDEFFPDAYMTRGEIAHLISNFADLKSLDLDCDPKVKISDITVDDICFPDVHMVINTDLMSLDGTNFLPDAFIRRGDVIKMINEMTSRKTEGMYQTDFIDIGQESEHYLDIYAASK